MNLLQKVAISTFGLSAMISSAAVTLGGDAAFFDIFLMEGIDSRSLMEWKDDSVLETSFKGALGLSDNSTVETIEANVMILEGSTLAQHTGAIVTSNDADFSNATTLPSGTPTNTFIDDANEDIEQYILDLRSLDEVPEQPDVRILIEGVDLSNGFVSVTYEAESQITVLDFDSINITDDSGITLKGRGEGFENDQFVIRIANDLILGGKKDKKGDKKGDGGSASGTAITLVNLDRDNVTWITSDDSTVDLHRNGGANFEGIIINPTEANGETDRTIIGDVDFKGQVFARSLKMGTGMKFFGNSIPESPSIPEPASNLIICFLATSSLLFRHRR